MSNELEIKWDWKDLINDTFMPLIENRDRHLILYGGRGSSKSDFAAKKIIYRCLNEPYFRCLVIRREYSTLRESCYQTLKDLIYGMGLDSLFEFYSSPLEIVCMNGNRFIFRGCDDTTKIKSVKDPSAIWWEEDIPNESDFITVTTTIRTTQADYLQEIFSINPEVEGDYTQHWFWKRFFESHAELSFSDKTVTKLEDGTRVELSYTCHHSTYKDNRWLPAEFIASLQNLKTQNEYYHQVFTLGRWGRKVTGGQFFRMFNISKNVAETKYDPTLPLWLSWDFNTMPGVTCGIFQVKGKTMFMVGEIQLPSPRNNTQCVVAEIIRLYPDHRAGIMVTGDSSGRHKDTRTVAGHNDYTIIRAGLQQHYSNVRERTPILNPPVVVSGNFVNNILEAGSAGYKGVQLIIGDKCQKMINDLLYLLEADDGTCLKQKVKDPNTGQTFERYGHFGDVLRYAVCTAFVSDFEGAKRGGRTGINSTFGKNDISKSKWHY